MKLNFQGANVEYKDFVSISWVLDKQALQLRSLSAVKQVERSQKFSQTEEIIPRKSEMRPKAKETRRKKRVKIKTGPLAVQETRSNYVRRACFNQNSPLGSVHSVRDVGTNMIYVDTSPKARGRILKPSMDFAQYGMQKVDVVLDGNVASRILIPLNGYCRTEGKNWCLMISNQ